MPDTKPDLLFDNEGVCNACRNYENREEVDWDQRKAEFVDLLDKYKSKDGSNWECIVPVSGGKDSTYQVIKILEMGLNPLCVTATTCDLSAIGRHNIDNIKKLGVDVLEFSPDKTIRARLNRIGLTDLGDISWPEHIGIFTIPVQVAVKYRVPLIIWGENPQHEYGGPAAALEDKVLTRRWLEEFGGLLGLRIEDLIDSYGIERRKLLPYHYPSDEELKKVGVTGVFLGYYIPWDGYANALIAQGYGLRTYEKTVEGSIVNYENLDNFHTGIHDYFKFLKFGFGRATDLACVHLRRGRLSRHDAIELVRRHDGKFPWIYLGKSLEEILKPLEMQVDEFISVCDRFTNKKIFATDHQGNLIKDTHGNLTKKVYPE